jgi:hypothetical protein
LCCRCSTPGYDRPLGRTITLERVGHHDPRRAGLPFQERAKQVLGRSLVASDLDQRVEHETLLVDGAPEPVFPAGNGEDDLVQMPLVAPASPFRFELV